jgi:hypothetical protein
MDVAELCPYTFCSYPKNVESNYSIFIASESDGCISDYCMAGVDSEPFIY